MVGVNIYILKSNILFLPEFLLHYSTIQDKKLHTNLIVKTSSNAKTFQHITVSNRNMYLHFVTILTLSQINGLTQNRLNSSTGAI